MRHFIKTAALISLIAILPLTGCKKKSGTILPCDCTLNTGDIVFRRGGGITSHAVLLADNGGKYSHTGIVVDSAGNKMIVHAVPDEPDCPGDSDRVKMETPESFFHRTKASIGEVKRLKGNGSQAAAAARYAVEIYRRGTPFDHNYDDSDTVSMYCCELVNRVYLKAGIRLYNGKKHDIHLPGMKDIHCLLPSDLCNSKQLVTIKSF